MKISLSPEVTTDGPLSAVEYTTAKAQAETRGKSVQRVETTTGGAMADGHAGETLSIDTRGD